MSKIITKLYKYDSSQEENGYRGEDFSSYILIGDSNVDNLDDTMDTVELTLIGLPYREEISPKTKFIYEKYQDEVTETPDLSLHLCLDSDSVSQPIISDDTYFDHHLSLIEAEVDAQGRVVDNIAVTYRLQDVSLENRPTYDQDAVMFVRNRDLTEIQQSLYSEYGSFGPNANDRTNIVGHKFIWEMPNWYQVDLGDGPVTPDWSYWNEFKLNQELQSDETSRIVKLPVPMLSCWGTEDGSSVFDKKGYCSIDVLVQRKNLITNETETIQQFRVDPTSSLPQEGFWYGDWFPSISPNRTTSGEIISRTIAVRQQNSADYYFQVKRSKLNEFASTLQNRVITIEIKNYYSYSIKINRHPFYVEDFAPNVQIYYDTYPQYTSWAKIKKGVFSSTGENRNQDCTLNDNYPAISTSFNTVIAGQNLSLYLRTAPIQTAYGLFNKAQLASQIYRKVDGVEVDETPKTYYLEPQDVEELKNTSIIENFYNQKNLHEIFMDIGKYIHARPVARFGSDNRYVLNWKRYGVTDKTNKNSNKITVFNSRFVNEYISSLSSYVTNMVQLGGTITEVVAPKSSSEDYLVYNDNAEIIVEKPITEIVDMNVICNDEDSPLYGQKRNLVGKGINDENPNGYVFEHSIYNILSVNPNDSVNKGMAIYYELGTNKIVGLNYRLPTQSAGDLQNDYSIKKIIADVFGINGWSIKVNDYLFEVVYRTKDTLRTDQARPDLRKYLLSSKYDRVPQHRQFNNQTDTVVDSEKFGNNTYGKLIRTGNTIYSMVEWVDSLGNIKVAGELCEIEGNLYYVSKVTNTYYPDHIISEVEFSKDFNRLAQVIGIPSEPRFYEISEQSSIRREVSLDDYVVLGTTEPTTTSADTFITSKGWDYMSSLLFENEQTFPKYAVTIFKSDKDKSNAPLGYDTYKVETCHPISTYSIENTLTLEWDLHDNFSAGDQVVPTAFHRGDEVDGAYNKLVPFRYPDVYGRADMIDFAIVKDYTPTGDEVMALPANPIDLEENEDEILSSNETPENMGKHDRGIVLLKDNREAINLNYNLQLLTDSDRFVISSYMWRYGKENVKLALLVDEVNKISSGTIPNGSFRVVDIPFTYEVEDDHIKINISEALEDYAQEQGTTVERLLDGMSALAIYSTNNINDIPNSGAKYFVFARNIGGLDLEEATKDWYISSYDKSMFEQQ